MDSIEQMQIRSCYHGHMHTHTAIKAHAQTSMCQRLDAHSHKALHTNTLHPAPQGHCAVSVARGTKETGLIDIPANSHILMELTGRIMVCHHNRVHVHDSQGDGFENRCKGGKI